MQKFCEKCQVESFHDINGKCPYCEMAKIPPTTFRLYDSENNHKGDCLAKTMDEALQKLNAKEGDKLYHIEEDGHEVFMDKEAFLKELMEELNNVESEKDISFEEKTHEAFEINAGIFKYRFDSPIINTKHSPDGLVLICENGDMYIFKMPMKLNNSPKEK